MKVAPFSNIGRKEAVRILDPNDADTRELVRMAAQAVNAAHGHEVIPVPEEDPDPTDVLVTKLLDEFERRQAEAGQSQEEETQ